jgi:hypothetical protein
MDENMLGRRRFLRSTAASVIGVAGGMVATGTAAADHNTQASGNVTVLSASNSWQYQISTQELANHKPPVEKRGKADPRDEIHTQGVAVSGNINEGGEDAYWFPDIITYLIATPDGWDSALEVRAGSTKYGNYIRMDATGNRFDYTILYGGRRADVDPAAGAETGNGDSVSGDRATGFVNAGGSDNYRIIGYLSDIIIADPYHYNDTGWEMRFYAD